MLHVLPKLHADEVGLSFSEVVRSGMCGARVKGVRFLNHYC